MTLISRIKSLCQDRGITLNQLEKLIGLKGTIARWEDHSPSLDKVRVAGADKDKLELIGHASTEMLRHYQDVSLADLRAITDAL